MSKKKTKKKDFPKQVMVTSDAYGNLSVVSSLTAAIFDNDFDPDNDRIAMYNFGTKGSLKFVPNTPKKVSKK